MKRLLVAGDWILVETKNEELVLRNSSIQTLNLNGTKK
jgi:hypothetical protein